MEVRGDEGDGGREEIIWREDESEGEKTRAPGNYQQWCRNGHINFFFHTVDFKQFFLE